MRSNVSQTGSEHGLSDRISGWMFIQGLNKVTECVCACSVLNVCI